MVQHPESGKLLVNFDKEIMQLIRETKYLQRNGVEVPESARMVLLQVGAEELSIIADWLLWACTDS
jgi:Dynein heavy chain, N-terminal region 1